MRFLHLNKALNENAFTRSSVLKELPHDSVAMMGRWIYDNHEDDVEEWKEHNDCNYDEHDIDLICKVLDALGLDDLCALIDAAAETHQPGHKMADHMVPGLQTMGILP